MHDSTLDLFTQHENEVLDDRSHMVETMRDAYWDAMNNCMDDGRPDDAVSIYSEWVVDGVDPEEGDFTFTFIEDLTDAE